MKRMSITHKFFVPKYRTQILFFGVFPRAGGVSTICKLRKCKYHSSISHFVKLTRAGQYGQYRCFALQQTIHDVEDAFFRHFTVKRNHRLSAHHTNRCLENDSSTEISSFFTLISIFLLIFANCINC